MFQRFEIFRAAVWSKVEFFGTDNLTKNARVVDDCFHLMVLRAIIAIVVIIAMIAGGVLLPRPCIAHFQDTEFNVWLHAW